MPAKILLDTNFLLIPGQFKVDIFSEIQRICAFNFELCVLGVTVWELKNIAMNRKGKDKASALLAMKLLKAKQVKVIGSEAGADVAVSSKSSLRKSASFKNADKTILQFAAENKDGVIVATQDSGLKSGLRKSGVRLIVLRQKKYLGFEG